MEIVDAQVHLLHPDRPILELSATVAASSSRPVPSKPHIDTITGEEMVAAMDAAGIDGAIIVSTAYAGWDNSYPLEVAAAYPERFRVVGRIDHTAADAPEQVAAWSESPHTVGLRIHLASQAPATQLREGAYDALLDAMERHHQTLCVFAPAFVADVGELARRRPGLQIVLDHLGLPTPVPGSPAGDVHAGVPGVVALAACPNMFIKFTGAPTLSAQPFPFEDIRPILHRYVEAFGAERVLWGTDWTRHPNVPYAEGIGYLRDTGILDEATSAEVLAGATRRAFRWPRPIVRP